MELKCGITVIFFYNKWKYNVHTTDPPFLAVYDKVVFIPAKGALHVGCITGGHIRLWGRDHRSA